MANDRGSTTAADVAWRYLSRVGGSFTRNVSVPTNVIAFANSDSASKRGSTGCWRNNGVRVAEPDMVIDDLMKHQNDRVKLHNPSRNTIHRSAGGECQRMKHDASGSLEAGSRDIQNSGQLA